MPLTASRLRENIYQVLDQILATGVPVEIARKGRTLRIVAVEMDGEKNPSKFDNAIKRPGVIIGDPKDLIHMDWSSEWRPFT